MLATLKPTSKELVYDLVTQAGVDTIAWANFKGEHPSANPKYCYDWAFWDETKSRVVLSLWYSQMDESGGVISQSLNYRTIAGASSHRDPSAAIRAKRAARVDHALYMAFKRKLPVRVIVADGARRGEAGADFSKVDLRKLDPVPWAVASYDSDSGDCRVVRGQEPEEIRTFLLTWGNFEETPDSLMLEVATDLESLPSSQTSWSSGNRRDMRVGERVILLRQGDDHPGILGRGVIAEAPAPDKHWNPEKRKAGIEAWYVQVNWHEMYPKEKGLSRERLVAAGIPTTLLNAQSSGFQIPDDVVDRIDELWRRHFGLSAPMGPNSSGANSEEAKRRLARIAFNSAGWTHPTGDASNLEADSTYNAKNRFGHEDWLFRSEWVIDGWRYAFIQGANKHRLAYVGQSLEVTLYTLQPDKRRRLVATIYGLECLTDDQANDALKIFRDRGWLDIMLAEVSAIGGNTSALGDPKWAPHVLNVRYRRENVDFHPAGTFLPDDPWIRDRRRYLLYEFPEANRVGVESSLRLRGGSHEAPKIRHLFRQGSKPVEYTPEHDRMQAKLMAELQAEYGVQLVRREQDFVDVRVETENELIFFEIKTDLDPRAVIRQALGQLLEYAYHPARGGRRPDKLVIVGRTPLIGSDVDYLSSLHSNFAIPVTYRVVAL